MKQVTKLNFEGQTIYCGLDVHKKQWSVCIRDEKMELKKFSQPADSQVLVEYLHRNYPGAQYKAVYEAGFSGFWAQRQLTAFGVECIVVHAADVPTSDKQHRGKSDPVDCRKLAKNLCDKTLEGIFIPDEQLVADRDIVRARRQLVKDQTRLKNRILSWLNFNGINIPEGYKQSTSFSNTFMNWLENLELKNGAKVGLTIRLEGVKHVRKQLLAVTRALRELSKTDRFTKVVSLLRSIPGIGLINAMCLATEIGDINRFRNIDHLCSYTGLKPDIQSTGDNIKIKGITSRCNHAIRESLVESAWVTMRLDPALRMAYKKYVLRMPANKAIIKIAKKLLARIRFVLTKQQPYVSGVVG